MLEQEMKFRLTDRETADAILDCMLVKSCAAGEAEQIGMRAEYFDTDGRDFGKKEITFRIRKESDKVLASLKIPAERKGAMHVRREFEIETEGRIPPEEAIEKLLAKAGPDILEECGYKQGASFAVICRNEFSRIQQRLISGAAEFFICVDIGKITAGGREEPICELEIEYISGNMDNMYDFASALKEAFGLEAESLSKFARGLALAESSPAR